MLEDRADNLDLISLAEKAQNTLTIGINKVQHGGATRGGAWAPLPRGKPQLHHPQKLNKIKEVEESIP